MTRQPLVCAYVWMSWNTGVFIVNQPAVSPLPVKRRLQHERDEGGEVEGGIRTPNQSEQQLTSCFIPGLTGTDTHSHGCTYVLTSSAGGERATTHTHTQPWLVIAIKF